jgi:hypothetical protein
MRHSGIYHGFTRKAEDIRNPYSDDDSDQAMQVYALQPTALGNTLKPSVRSQRLTISSPQPMKYLTQSTKEPAYPASAQTKCNFGNR